MHEVTMCTYGKTRFLSYVPTYEHIFSEAFADRLHLKCAFLCFNIREMEFKRFNFRDEICSTNRLCLNGYGAPQNDMKRLYKNASSQEHGCLTSLLQLMQQMCTKGGKDKTM